MISLVILIKSSTDLKKIYLGIAFVLTLQDTFGAGVAILVAMLVKLVPQKVGHAVILTSAGLNHFWENVFATLAVMTVYIGLYTVYLFTWNDMH